MNTTFNFHELKASGRLPSPSGTALAIMKLVQQDDATIHQVTHLVKADPALSGRILSFINSAAFGTRRPIATVQDAAMLMGMQAVRNIALSFSLVDKNTQGNCPGFDYALYWSQSLAVAVSIASLTARERTVSPEEAFTLGLLSDIGRLALVSAWPEGYNECLIMAQGKQLLKLEQEHFAIDHHALCLMLLADWGIPAPFIDALRLSQEAEVTEISRTGRFARQLIFARQLAHYCLADANYQAVLLEDLEKEACHHAMDKTTLLKFVDNVTEQLHAWGKEIGIKTDKSHSLPETLDESFLNLPTLDILLVDDDSMITTRLSKQLSKVGHRVSVCRDGESALKYVIEHRPSILITDWRMQPMDGLELCKTLRASAFGKSLYIIMLTAAESEDDLVEAFAAGIDDYVTKLVKLRELLSRLRAGQRIVLLQQEVEKERRDIQRYTKELAANNRRLEQIAHTDLLTELPNRRYALSRLAREFDAGLRLNRPLSVLMLDLDHFKVINDTFGHDVGDQVLAHAAKLIRQSARVSDIACRLGGEEFLVIATNTDGATAMLLAERIRNTIEKNQPKNLALRDPLTISIGVAGSTGPKPDWKELMILADQALYRVKQGSRNGAQLASS